MSTSPPGSERGSICYNEQKALALRVPVVEQLVAVNMCTYKIYYPGAPGGSVG